MATPSMLLVDAIEDLSVSSGPAAELQDSSPIEVQMEYPSSDADLVDVDLEVSTMEQDDEFDEEESQVFEYLMSGEDAVEEDGTDMEA